MKLGKFQQTPLENKIYVIDYSQWLGSGETIQSMTTTIANVTDPPFVVDGEVISADKKSVSFFASGGLDGSKYEVEVIMATSSGEIKNDQIFYFVKQR